MMRNPDRRPPDIRNFDFDAVELAEIGLQSRFAVALEYSQDLRTCDRLCLCTLGEECFFRQSSFRPRTTTDTKKKRSKNIETKLFFLKKGYCDCNSFLQVGGGKY